MTLRNNFVITAAVVCHLLLAPALVTSQLPPVQAATARALEEEAVEQEKAAQGKGSGESSPCAQAAAAQKDVETICAIEQEQQGSTYKLHGAAEIYYGTYVLKA